MSRPKHSGERQPLRALSLSGNFAVHLPVCELFGEEGLASGPIELLNPGVVPDPVADPVVRACARG